MPEAETRRWERATLKEQAEKLRQFVVGVIVRAKEVEIRLTKEGASALAPRRGPAAAAFKVPVQLKPQAVGTTIVTLEGNATRSARVDRALVRASIRANHWRELLESGEARTAYDLARLEACRVSYIQRHLPLAFLSPKLVEAIIDGRQPPWCVLSDLVESPKDMIWTKHPPAD